MFIKSVVILAAVCILNIEGTEKDGYKYYPEIQSLLKLHRTPADWQTARMNCHDEDAILAAPVNDEFWKIIIDQILNPDLEVNEQAPPAIYAGVIEHFPEGVYKYRHKNNDQEEQVLSIAAEDIAMLERCVVYDANGTKSLVDCGLRFPYVCHAPITDVETCHDNDTEYKLDERTGHCYKFHAQSEVWNDALRICQEEGGHLAVINSNVEARVLMDLFEEYPFEKLNGTNVAWGVMAVGFYYWRNADTYITIHGETLEQAGYAEWSYGNPSSRHKSLELGGGMFRSGLLDDLNKTYKVPFICEKKPVPVRESTCC